jgi:hypothetical protein
VGFPKGAIASPLVKGGVKTPPAKWFCLLANVIAFFIRFSRLSSALAYLTICARKSCAEEIYQLLRRG